MICCSCCGRFCTQKEELQRLKAGDVLQIELQRKNQSYSKTNSFQIIFIKFLHLHFVFLFRFLLETDCSSLIISFNVEL